MDQASKEELVRQQIEEMQQLVSLLDDFFVSVKEWADAELHAQESEKKAEESRKRLKRIERHNWMIIGISGVLSLLAIIRVI